MVRIYTTLNRFCDGGETSDYLSESRVIFSACLIGFALTAPFLIFVGFIWWLMMEACTKRAFPFCIVDARILPLIDHIATGHRRFVSALLSLALVSGGFQLVAFFFDHSRSPELNLLLFRSILAAVYVAILAFSFIVTSKEMVQGAAEREVELRKPSLLVSLWNDLSFFTISFAMMYTVALPVVLPGGVAEQIVGWLTKAASDANMLSVPHGTVGYLPDIGQLGARTLDWAIGSIGNYDFILVAKIICTSVLGYLLLPFVFRCSDSITRSISVARSRSSFREKVITAIKEFRSPVKDLQLNHAFPVLHNISMTFLWILFCYIAIFSLVAFTQGGLGAAICNWLDASMLDANFKEINTTTHPQLRYFLASLVALIGLVPAVVTGCVYLPAFKPRTIQLSRTGILVPRGPYISMLFRPMRRWRDFKKVSLSGRNKDLSKRSIKIGFHSGGSISIKSNQLSPVDLHALLGAIDENADFCTMTEDVLELRRLLRENESDTSLVVQGDLRSLTADSFKSTVFVPCAPGEKLEYPNRDVRVVRVMATKQLSAVYLVRIEGEQLAVAKHFHFPDSSGEAEQMRRSFVRESEILGDLDHPQLVEMLGVSSSDKSSILLLELARGSSLREIVESSGPLPVDEVVMIAKDLCRVLDYLHSRVPPVVHRDLTPTNVILETSGAVKLIDFGAAHQFLEGITGTLIGKQNYVAPEQLRGEPCPASDLYALGCTMYFLLTGEDPVALRQSDPSLKMSLPAPLNELIKRLTSFEADHRPDSIAEIQSCLEDVSDFGSNATVNISLASVRSFVGVEREES